MCVCVIIIITHFRTHPLANINNVCVPHLTSPSLAGNHESVTMNQMYGFQGEVKAKYTAQMAELFTEVYNWLPLAHCLSNRVLVSEQKEKGSEHPDKPLWNWS